MATSYYCANVAGELEGLSEKLHHLSEKIDRVPSVDKYKFQTHIDELHIIMTELDDRLCELATSCSTAEMLDESRPVRDPGVKFTDPAREPARGNELFDYDIGG